MINYEILKYGIQILIVFLVVVEAINYVISLFCRSNKNQAVLRVISFVVVGLAVVLITSEKFSIYNDEYLRYIENKNKCFELLEKNND